MDAHRKIDPVLAAKQGRLPLGLDEPSSDPGVPAAPAVVASPVTPVPVSEAVHAVAPVASPAAVEAASMPIVEPVKPEAGADAAPSAVPEVIPTAPVPAPAAAAPKPVAAPVPVSAPAPVAAATAPKSPTAGTGPLTPRVSPIRKAAALPVAGKAAGGVASAPMAGSRPSGAGSGLPVDGGAAVLGAPRVVFTFGRVVRDHREKAGLDIPALSQKTKVPKDFLENLEANRLEALPPPVYAKSYLRLLCREFAMDPAPCLEEYGRVQAARQNETVAAPFALTSEDSETGAKVGYAPRQTQPKPEKKSAMLKKLNPALIAAGVVVIGLVLVALIAFAVNRGSAHKSAAAAGATAAAGVDLEKFITPQQLPMNELPVPGR